MKRIISKWIFLLFLINVSAGFGQNGGPAPDPPSQSSIYWIVFNEIGLFPSSPVSKQVMQINVLGDVVKPPVQVVRGANVPGKPGQASALARSDETHLALWFPVIKTNGPNEIYTVDRAIVDGKTLGLVSVQETSGRTSSSADSLSVTKSDCTQCKRKFLSAENPDQQFVEIRIGPNNFPNGKVDTLAPPTGGAGRELSLSYDARLATYVDKKDCNSRLFLQPLDDLGHLTGKPHLVASVPMASCTAGFVSTGRVSNVLPTGNRLMVYLHAPDDYGGSIPDDLLIQAIDPVTIEKVGNPSGIFNDIDESIRGFAMDPAGRFVLIALKNKIVIQALDSNGHKSGNRRTVFQASNQVVSINGIDILQR